MTVAELIQIVIFFIYLPRGYFTMQITLKTMILSAKLLEVQFTQ